MKIFKLDGELNYIPLANKNSCLDKKNVTNNVKNVYVSIVLLLFCVYKM